MRAGNKKRKFNTRLNFRFIKEPVGFEPTMADLQSTALGLLATAPCLFKKINSHARRINSLYLLHILLSQSLASFLQSRRWCWTGLFIGLSRPFT